jgi:hypothetical protein
MDHRDHPDLILGGADCAACGSTVPGSRIRLLAERDDLVFAELTCAVCGTRTLAIVVRAAPTSDAAAAAPREVVESPHDRRPVSSDDVLDMHESLATYDGDLRDLVTDTSDDRRGGAA